MKVFLTGATGFIGRHLAELLSREGHHVRCLVRAPSGASWMNGLPGLTTVAGDIDSLDAIERSASDSDVVFHLAGVTRAMKKKDFMETNGTASGRLARAVRQHGPEGCRLVYLSSLAAAGPCTSENAIGADCTPAPVSPYGESKLLGENLVRETRGNAGWTTVRAPAVYGPRDRDVLFLFRLARWGIILQVRNAVREGAVIHVNDLVRALLLAATRPEADGRTYHVSDGKIHHRDDIADALRAAVGRGVPVALPGFVLRAAGLAGDIGGLFTGRPAVLNSDRAKETLQCGWVCDDSSIRQDLGFEALIPLEEGFKQTAAWYRKQGWL